MSDLVDVFLSDEARVAAIAMSPEQRGKLLHTLRSLQRDPEIGKPYTAGNDVSGRIIVVPGDDAVPGMTLTYRTGEEQLRIVNILVGP